MGLAEPQHEDWVTCPRSSTHFYETCAFIQRIGMIIQPESPDALLTFCSQFISKQFQKSDEPIAWSELADATNKVAVFAANHKPLSDEAEGSVIVQPRAGDPVPIFHQNEVAVASCSRAALRSTLTVVPSDQSLEKLDILHLFQLNQLRHRYMVAGSYLSVAMSYDAYYAILLSVSRKRARLLTLFSKQKDREHPDSNWDGNPS